MESFDLMQYLIDGGTLILQGGGLYFGTLILLNGGSKLFSEKITEQEQLDDIIQEEADRLGMTKPVKGKLWYDESIAEASATNGDNYRIDLGGMHACRASVRHELYHLYKGDCDKQATEIQYFFLHEPRAILYEVFRLRL